jgi:Tfp pilus assembly protein PilV
MKYRTFRPWMTWLLGNDPSREASAFSLVEVCLAAVILAFIGAQMYQLSSLSRQNFVLTKNYLEADKKLYSEIAWARQAAQRYTWCDVLYGVDYDTNSFERNPVAFNSDLLNNRSFCPDNQYLTSPVRVYRPPAILSTLLNDTCYAYSSIYLTNGVPSASAIPQAIGVLYRHYIPATGYQQFDYCVRFTAFNNKTKFPEYSPWYRFKEICRIDMGDNSYDPTGTTYLTQNLNSDPIVGNLVFQLVNHAKANNIMTKQYNNSRVDRKQTHRIQLAYSIFYNFNASDATDGSTEKEACAAAAQSASAPMGGCRSITRVVFIDAPVARWCP